MKKFHPLMSAVLILALAWPGLSQAQDPARAAFEEALKQVHVHGDLPKCIEQLRKVTEDFPDSGWALTARFEMARQTRNQQESLAIYHQIAVDYPETRTYALAKLDILEIQHRTDLENWLAGALTLALEFNSPPPAEVLEGINVAENVDAVRGLPLEQQRALGLIYSSLWGKLALTFGEYERALPLAVFLRSALEPLGITAGNNFHVYFSLADSPVSIPSRRVDPTVAIHTPGEGSIVGLNPTISATLSSGDFRNVGIDLYETQIELDGRDVKPQSTFHSEFDTTLAEGVDFEKIHVSLKPGPLSPGQHTVTFTVPILEYEEGEGLTRISRTFIASKNPPPPLSTLSSSKDSTLVERNQHQSEGMNPFLTLEKIEGKTARIAVDFDLNSTSLLGLSQATLILTIDPTQHIDGWGNGRTISAQALNTPWQEGNGKSFGLQKKHQVSGTGSGATWFSPVDEDISNDFANSAVNWNGAAASVSPPTAPAVEITNHSSGEVHFDVTADVLNGATNGWLIKKDQENLGSKVSFYSKEGAAAAGIPDLAPRLLLEFGDSVAASESDSNTNSLLSHIGLGEFRTSLRSSHGGSEIPSMREVLQRNPVAALAAEQVLYEVTRAYPMLSLTSGLVYRSWLADTVLIAIAPFRAA